MSDRMSPVERRAALSLASIFALRMLGLFLMLPVFAVHAQSLPGGDDAALVGLALGIYGLTQAMLQIPFGMASDRIGRKRVIIAGLVLFALGSVMAATATTVMGVLLGRAVQGAGAISAAVTAFLSDLTRDSQRTKAMAIVGSSIGLMFALSLVGAPLLYQGIGMSGIFWLTALLATAAIGVVIWVVPAENTHEMAISEPITQKPPLNGHLQPTSLEKTHPVGVLNLVMMPELLRLNIGVLALHTTQMAMFVVVPAMLVTSGLAVAQHWRVYLPAVLASFVLMAPAIMLAEKRGLIRAVFLAAVALVLAVQAGFWWLNAQGASLWPIAILLLLFFVGFNVLEANLPSLVSRCAPPTAKGAALGVFNTTQAFGLFLGGALGGWLTKHSGAGGVFMLCTGLMAVWLAVAWAMRAPPRRAPEVSV
jgi:MFS family permease